MTKSRAKSDYRILTVIHALNLLEQFAGKSGEMSVTEIAQELKLAKEKVYRLLVTLENRGYVEKIPGKDCFKLGLKTLDLSQNYLRQGGLLNRALPLLEDLRKSTQETTYLALLQKDHIVYASTMESSLPVHVASRQGIWLPAYCTASGKALLAHLSEAEIDRLFPEEVLQDFTERTKTSKAALKYELKQIRLQGFAVEDEEYDQGVRCVAAPVWDHTGRTVGALSISGPSFRMLDDRIKSELAPLVRQSCTLLSRRLGYQGSGGECLALRDENVIL